jgi:hypothetical protein
VLIPKRFIPLALLALAPVVAACGSSTPEQTAPTSAPASTPAEESGRYISAEANTEGQVQIYSEPDESKKLRTLTNPRLINDDPNLPVPLVMMVEEEQGDWLKVSLPVRPNGSVGWVKAADFSTIKHNFRVEITLGAFDIKAFDGDQQVFQAKIGLGTDENPTPGGTYYTTELLEPPDPNGPYGKYAYGLSGHSDTLTSFAGGPGQLGVHGTNQPDKIGSKVSAGCIRLTNADIEKLVQLGMPLGTPVIIKA